MKQHFTKFSAIVSCVAMACALSFTACQPNGNVSQEQIDSLQAKLDSIMAVHNQIKDATASEYNGALATKDSTITAQAGEIQRLLNQLNKAKKAQQNSAVPQDNSGKVKEQQKQIKEYQRQLKDNQLRVSSLENKLQKQQEELKQFQMVKPHDMSANQDELARLQQQIRDQKSEIATLNTLLKNVANSDVALTQCNQDKAALDLRIAALQAQLDGMKNQLQNNVQTEVGDAAEVLRLQQQVKALEAQLAAAQERSSAVDKVTVELTNAKAELADCQVVQGALRAEIAALKEEKSVCDSFMRQQQKAMTAVGGAADKVAQDYNDAMAKNVELQQQLSTLQLRYNEEKSRNEALAAQIAELQKSIDSQKNNAEQVATGVNEQLAALQSQIDALTAENAQLKAGVADANAATVAALQAEVSRQQAELSALQAELNAKNSALQAKEAELAALKKGGKAVAGDVNAKLQELQALCDGYVEEIARLKAENEALKAENAALRETSAQAQQVLTDNAELLKKVEMASVLVMSDVKAAAGKSISGTTMKEVSKAAQVKMVRVGGTILANNVITPGSVTIYVRIANAANRVVCNGNPGDQTFDMNGIDMQYTTSQVIEFTGASRAINILWRKFDNVTMEPGLYWATLYANGYEIGKTSFTLK